ncbi:MAG TPA: hypothetical protein VFV43_08685 [Limnobacter sp.]|nr:hypothetical protein [Limnobacter sp.]
MPQLANALASKQGFVYIREDAGPSPIHEFVQAFSRDGSVDLGNGCRLIGAYAPPPQKQSVFSPLWTFQVYDANLEASFEVPVTEVPFTDLANPSNRTEQLIHLNNCMDTHLRALPDAFKDSTACPSILCPEYPRLAQLLTAQEECLGKQHRGELGCRESIDWICAAEELLQTISPENPRFRGEESCDFESFFRRTGVYNLGLQTLPFSIGQHNFNAAEAGVIRGFKRHLPDPKAKANMRSNLPSPPYTSHTQRLGLDTGAPGPSMPQWLRYRDIGRAYKEPVRQMQCASQAINGLLQHGAVTPELFSQHLAVSRLHTLEQLGIRLDVQKGMTHPKVMAAVIDGRSVEISKQEFLGPTPLALDIATEQTPLDSWKALINLSPVGRGKNWVQNSEELHTIERLTITPDMWVSAQRGAETTELLTLLNHQLAVHQEEYLPAQMTHWSTRDHQGDIQGLEALARQAVQNHRDFPIVIRTGAESGHFQTIVPDSKGNWLTLNSDGIEHAGVQTCNRWCGPGELTASFQRAGVSDILIPQQSNARRGALHAESNRQ